MACPEVDAEIGDVGGDIGRFGDTLNETVDERRIGQETRVSIEPKSLRRGHHALDRAKQFKLLPTTGFDH